MKINALKANAIVYSGGLGLEINAISKTDIQKLQRYLPEVDIDSEELPSEDNVLLFVDGSLYKFNWFLYTPYDRFGNRLDTPIPIPGVQYMPVHHITFYRFTDLVYAMSNYASTRAADEDIVFKINMSVRNLDTTEPEIIYIPKLLPYGINNPTVTNNIDTNVILDVTVDNIYDVTQSSVDNNIQDDEQPSASQPWSIYSHVNKIDGLELHAAEWNVLFEKIQDKINDIITFCNSVKSGISDNRSSISGGGTIIDTTRGNDETEKEWHKPADDVSFEVKDGKLLGVADLRHYTDIEFNDGNDQNNIANYSNNSSNSIEFYEDYSDDKFYVNGVEYNQRSNIVLDENIYEYRLTGTLHGSVVIDRTNVLPSKNTKIILDGVKIINEDSNFAISYTTTSNNADYKDLDVILAPNTVNLLICTNKLQRNNSNPASLESTTNIKIHGLGYLGVYNAGGHGIKAMQVRIIGPHIYIDVNHDGIHGKLIECLFTSIYANRAHNIIGTGTYGSDLPGVIGGGKIFYLKMNVFASENGVDGWWFSTEGGWFSTIAGNPYLGYSSETTTQRRRYGLDFSDGYSSYRVGDGCEYSYYEKWDGFSSEYLSMWDQTRDGSGQGTQFVRTVEIPGDPSDDFGYVASTSKNVVLKRLNLFDKVYITSGESEETVLQSGYAVRPIWFTPSEILVSLLSSSLTNTYDYKDYNITSIFGQNRLYESFEQFLDTVIQPDDMIGGTIVFRASRGSYDQSALGIYYGELIALNKQGEVIPEYTESCTLPFGLTKPLANKIFLNNDSRIDHFVIRIPKNRNQPEFPSEVKAFSRQYTLFDSINNLYLYARAIKIKGTTEHTLVIPRNFSYSDGHGGTSSDITIFLDGATLSGGIRYLPTNGTLKIVTLNGTYNFIGEQSLDGDSIKSEGDIKIQTLKNSYLYVTSGKDGIVGDNIVITDSEGTVIVEDCGECGIKGSNIVIGPDAAINNNDITLITNGTIAENLNKSFTEMSGTVLVKDNCRNFLYKSIPMDRTSIATIKNTGFCDIYARLDDEVSKGNFATHPSGLTGVLMVGSIASSINTDGGLANDTFQYNIKGESDKGGNINHYTNMPSLATEGVYAIGYNAIYDVTIIPYSQVFSGKYNSIYSLV